MPRFAELQQPQAVKESAKETSRGKAKRAATQDRQSPAASVSNQRMQRKLRNSAKEQKQQEEQPPGPDEKAEAVAELLRTDASDQSGQARGRLDALPADERAEVEAKAKGKLSESDRSRAEETLAAPAPLVTEVGKPSTPDAEAKGAAPKPAEEAEKREDERAVEVQQEEEKEEQEEGAPDEKKKERKPKQPLSLKGKKPDELGPDGKPKPADAKAKPEGEKSDEAKPEDEKAGEKPGEKTDEKAKFGAATAVGKSGAKEEATPAVEGAPKEEGAKEEGAEAKKEGAGEAAAPGAAGAAPSGPAQAAAGKALESMGAPAEAKAAVSPGGGAAAPKAAAPASAALSGGGGGGGDAGGGGGEAAVEEAEAEASPEEEAAAEKTDEKMAGASPDTEEEPTGEPEPQADEMSPDKAMDEAEKAPKSERDETAKAAEEQEKADQAGGEAPASEEEAAEENAAPAAATELPAAERDAALGSLAEEAGGGGGEGGGGGGGGGGAVLDKEAEAPPDVSGAAPAAAMATVSSLKVGQIAGAISSVSASVDKSVTDKKTELSADAPSMERPSGAPETKESRTVVEEEGGAPAAGELEEATPEGESVSAEEQIQELPEAGPAPTDEVSTPAVAGNEGGELSEEDVQRIGTSVDQLPTTDPALAQTAGPPPQVELAGEADPALAEDQRTQLEQTTADLETEGAQDAAKPLGEDEIFPVVPQETLTTSAGQGAAEGGGAEVAVDDETAAIVAEEKDGDAIRADAASAQTEMAQAEADQESEETAARNEHDQEVQQAISENEGEQTAQRNSAKSQVDAKRGEWTTEQRTMVDSSRTDADAAMAESDATIESEQTTADEQASKEIEHGNEEAATARRDAESEAGAQKQKAEDEKDGFFGWLASAFKSFFNGIISAIGKAFAAARALVKAAIELAQKAAAAIIDAARAAIILAIKAAGAVCSGLADVLLAGFPELRDRIKGAIQSTVAAAEDAVNELADSLKRGIQELLDKLGKALDAALASLEKGLKGLVEALAKAVDGAIKAAKAAIDALATFAVLVRDIASNPGQWLSNLGAAIVDGIQNHLWAALKSAIAQWFNAKLEAVLGLGTAIWEVLKKGSISIAQVGQMAFTALKAAIPMILIQLLVEKLVSMIVPAAGAVMAIVEGLQAAWGTISQILNAIGKFITFLKAVKGGSAGPQFAQAVAAGAVAVIDFVSNWLLAKLIKPAKKVGGKVKAMASKIMAKLKKIGAKIARAAKKIIKKIKKGLKKIAKKLGLGKKKKKKKSKKDKQKDQDKLDKAVRELRPKIDALASKKVSGVRLRAQLLGWRIRYRLSRLTAQKAGGKLSVEATVNPSRPVIENLVNAQGERLFRMIREVADDVFSDPSTVQAMQRIHEQRQGGAGQNPENPIDLPANLPGQALDIRTNQRTQPVSHYDMGGARLREYRGPGATAGRMNVMDITPGGGAYGSLIAPASALGAPALSTSLSTMATRGVLPPGVPSTPGNVQLIGGLSRLGAVEMARDQAEVARYALRLDTMAMGGLTPEQHFLQANPMSLQASPTTPGGARTAHDLNQRFLPQGQFDPTYQSPVPAKQRGQMPGRMMQFISMERQAAIEWLTARMLAGDPIFRTEAELERYVRKEMQDHVRSVVKGRLGV